MDRDSGTSRAARTNGDRLRLHRSDLLLILAFWTVFAVLTAANRLLDPDGIGFRSTASIAPVEVAFIESYVWALLTPAIFWLGVRFSLERGSRTQRILLLLGVGMVVSAAMVWLNEVVRQAVIQFPHTASRSSAQSFRW